MKRILSIILTISMLCALMPTVVFGAEMESVEVASAVQTAKIEIGDYIQLGTYYGEPIVWCCVDIDKNGPLMLSDKILTVKPYDAGTGNNAATGSHARSDKRDKGSNYWADSNLRSWLNSSASAGAVEWLCGNAPIESAVLDGFNEYADEAGFLNGFTAVEKGLLKSVTQKCILAYPEISEKMYTSGNARMENNYNISKVLRNYDTAYAEEATDKIFLLDEKQISTVYNNGDILGSNYYIGKFSEKAKANSEYEITETSGDYWLRSAGSDYESYVRYVSSSGSVGNYDAYSYRAGVRPAFYSASPSFSYGLGDGSEKNPYVFAELSEDVDYPYIISEAYFNADGDKLTVNLEYIGKNVQSAKLIAARYDEKDALEHTEIIDVNGTEQVSFDFTKEYGEFVRVFVWKDMNLLTPLSEVVVPTQKTGDVTKLEGKVIANSITALDYPKSIDTSKKAEVTIDVTYNYNLENDDFEKLGNYKFNVAGTDAESYLGLAVVFSVKKNVENEYDIVSIEPKSGKNDKVEFTLDKFDDAGEQFGEFYLKYLAKPTHSQVTKLSVQSDADIIYNNIGGTFTFEELFVSDDIIEKDNSLGGKVTLYDTDNKTGYDLIFVEIAAYGVVDEVYNGKITFKNYVGSSNYLNTVGSIYVDEEYTDYIVNITKDGKTITADEIKENDVLSIITNNVSEVYNIEVLSGDNVIKGEVSVVSGSYTSITGQAYTINGVEYDVAEGAYKCDNIKAGTSGIFYIDPYGKIISLIEEALPVAYVLGATANGNDFAPEIQFKLLTEDQGITIYNVASTVTINDEIYVEENDTDAILEAIGEGSVITYKASENEIKSIILPGYDDEGFQEVSLFSGCEYDADNLRFGKRDVDENTKVFFISDDEESMGVGTIDNLIDEVNYDGALAFVMDEDWEALDVIIIRDAITKMSGELSAGIIIDISEDKNTDNNSIYKIEYLQDGEIKTVKSTTKLYNAIDVYDINKGDICKFLINVNGLLSDIMPIVDFENGIRKKYDENNMAAKLYYDFSNSPGYDEKFVIAPILDYNTSTGSLTIGNILYKLVNAENVYVIDPSGDNLVSVGSIEDIDYDKYLQYAIGNVTDKYGNILAADGDVEGLADYVFIRVYDGEIKDVVIIKAYDYGRLYYEYEY